MIFSQTINMSSDSIPYPVFLKKMCHEAAVPVKSTKKVPKLTYTVFKNMEDIPK